MGTTQPDEAARLRNALVDDLVRQGTISSSLVERAFRDVPRHLFLPGTDVTTAYADEPVVILWDEERALSSSSQPTMMAIMADQLLLEPGMRVLEIGAGSGYNAAVLAHIVGESGMVVTLDIDEGLVLDAARHLSDTGYGWVEAVCQDGAGGYDHGKPYDRIVVTALANDVSPHWTDQLKDGGVMVVPLWFGGLLGLSVALEKRSSELASVSVSPCGFMPLRGDWQWTEGYYPITETPDAPPLMSIALDREGQVDLAALYGLLTADEAERRSLGRSLNGQFVSQNLASGLFIGLKKHPGGFWLFPTGSPDSLLQGVSFGLIDTDQMSATILNDRFPEQALVYGGDATYGQLIELLDWWDNLGRPSIHDLRVRVLSGSPGPIPDNSWIMAKNSVYTWLLSWGRPAGD